MNRIFRTLWSVATQSWQAVPETAKTAGKKSTSSASGVVASVALSFTLTGGAGAQSPTAINQLPTAGTVVRGSATISQTATAQAAAMTVKQTSQRAVVNWDTFNVGSAASVNFVQPNAQTVILNRVNDSNPSQIFGRITSNGQVFLSNANGVYFSPTSSVDVGAITATTHSINNDNFMSGNYVFERNGATGKVVNEGRINAALGGYVALLAPEVQNTGVVVARAGTVAMAAGEMITLNMGGAGSLAGITTTPSAIASLIENKQAVQAPDGQIILSAVALNKLQAGVIKNSGSLEANSLVSKGGKIYLEADDITLASTSQIEAKGAAGGGTVLVGGDWQGSGDMRQATQVSMAAGATIDASATDKGDGGKVVLWSDVHNADSQTLVHGSIKAEAGLNGGNGGKIETSGHYLNVDDIQVNTQSSKSKNGDWLLDPYSVTITDNATAQSGTGTTYIPTSSATASFTSDSTSTIKASNIATGLGYGNVIITTGGTTGDINGYGDIKIASSISWNSNNNLTFSALGEIWGVGNLTRTGGGGINFNQTGNSKNATVNSVSYLGGYSGIISGTGTVTKTGVGTMVVSGQSTYTGATTISEGTLKIGRSGSTGSSSAIGLNSALTIASGAILDVDTYATQVGQLTGTGSITLGTRNTGSSPTFSIGGGTSASDSSNFFGSISGSQFISLTKIGDGIQTLSGLSSYGGRTYVNAGTLKLGRASEGTSSAIGSSTYDANGLLFSDVTIGSSGTLDLNGYSPASGKSLIINGGTLLNSSATDVNWAGNSITTTSASIRATGGGAINLTASTNSFIGRSGVQPNFTYQPITLEGKIGLSGPAYLMASTASLTSGSNTQFTYSPSISTTLSTIFQGAGDLFFSPTGASPKLAINSTNTYTGNFTVNRGVVQVNGDGALGAVTNPITVKDGGSLSLNYSAPTTVAPFPRNISISGYGVDITASGVTTKYGALDYANAGNSYYGGTITLNGTTRFTESGSGTLNARGTIQTNNYDFIDTNLPKLVVANATLLGDGTKKTAIAYVGAYDATNSYTSIYGTSPTVSYQVFTDAAATTAATTPAITTDTPIFNLPTNLTGAGSYAVSYQSGLRSSTYALFATTATKTWTVSKAHLTVTANDASKTYGDTNPILTTTVSGFVNGQTLANSGVSGSGTATTTATTTSPAGTQLITAGVGNLTATNYDFTNLVDGTLTINKANLTVTPTTGQSKIYGDQDPSLLTYASLTNQLVGGDTSIAGITGSLTRAIGETVGNYTYSIGNLSATNYTFTLAPSSSQFNINPRPITLTATTQSKTYGNADPTLAATITSGSLASVTVSDTLADVTGTLTRTAGENAGSYDVALGTGSKAGNYAITYATNNQAFTIDRRAITLAATAVNKTYGNADPALTATITAGSLGSVSANDTLADITGKLTRTAGENVGSYDVALGSGAKASNYNITFAANNQALTIDPRAVVLSGQMNFSGQSMLDTASTGSTLAATNLVGNDSLTFGGTVAIAAANAGAQAITGFSSLTLSNPNYTKTGASGSVTVLPISAINVTTLNNTDVAALIGSQFAGITGSQIGSFSNSQLQVFSAQQIASLSSSQLSGFNGAQIGSLSSAQLQGIRPAQVALLAPAQLAGLDAAQVASFSTPQLQALTAAQVNAISPTQISALSAAQISLLTGNTAAPLSFAQVFALSPNQVAAIQPAQLSRMTAAEVGSFTDAQLQALTPGQIAAISPTSFGALGAEQIMAMSGAQVQSLSPEQLASFTPLQVASLSAAELGNFDATQLAAIGIFPKQEPSNKFEAAIPVMTAVAPDVTRMSGLEVRALSPEQLNALPVQQVTNLKPVQLQALTTTQLSQLTPEQADNLSPSQLAVMSPRQLQALPTAPVTTTDTTPRTGVLAVTILQNTTSKPVSAGIAFEQDADTVSLKVTAAPVALPISEKVVFNDKLTTFLVATTSGEMVEFQGSLVNNRMVILAPSAMAKRVASTEMSLVLAAAVTSLGKENRVMLAKLDGVVLDLR